MRKPLLGILLIAACGGGGDPPADDQPQYDAPIGTGTPTAFRFTDLDVRDPHIHVSLGVSCSDLTESSVNPPIQDGIEMDGDDPPDGLLDISAVFVFRPLDQTDGNKGLQIYFADCTAPLAGTSCTPGTAAPIAATATNMAAGTCLNPVSGTLTDPYSPEVTTSPGPCFVSDAQNITVALGSIPIMLTDARVSATYSGNPATGLTNGLMIGFISEAVADATTLPADLPLIGGDPLSSVLPGGTDACDPGHDDRDMNNGESGWWFYLNFTAEMVPWSDT